MILLSRYYDSAVQFHELLEDLQGTAAVDAFAGNLYALLDALLTLLQHLNTESGSTHSSILFWPFSST